MNIAIILLAAGLGRRFGGEKLLAEWNGKYIYQYAVDCISYLETNCVKIVVTRQREIQDYAKAAGLTVVLNSEPELGIAHSIQLGMERLEKEITSVDGILFAVCDQPAMKRSTLQTMIDGYKGGILVSETAGHMGNPVIFSIRYAEELKTLKGDTGGRQIIQRFMKDVCYFHIKDKIEMFDVDFRENLEELRKRGGSAMDKINFDQLGHTWPLAEGVEEAMANGEADANVLDEAREKVSRLFKGETGENVIFTSSVEEAFGVTIRNLFKKGDHLLISSMESNAVMNLLNSIGHESGKEGVDGIEYSKIPCDEKGHLVLFDPREDTNVFAKLDALLQPNTRGIILNHASEVCGSLLQAKQVGEFAKKHNLIFILNTTQSAGHVPIFMQSWNVDVITFNGGYGLLGPKEAAGFLASSRVIEMLGGEKCRETYEAKNLDMKVMAGFNKALEFMLSKNIQFLSGQGYNMVEYFLRKVQHISGIHIIGPGYKERVPIISLQTDFMPEAEVKKALEEEWNIYSDCGYQDAEEAHHSLGTYPRGILRFSFDYFTDINEMEIIVKALYQLTVRTDILPSGSSFPKE